MEQKNAWTARRRDGLETGELETGPGWQLFERRCELDWIATREKKYSVNMPSERSGAERAGFRESAQRDSTKYRANLSAFLNWTEQPRSGHAIHYLSLLSIHYIF